MECTNQRETVPQDTTALFRGEHCHVTCSVSRVHQLIFVKWPGMTSSNILIYLQLLPKQSLSVDFIRFHAISSLIFVATCHSFPTAHE